MIELRPVNTLGQATYDWLFTRYHFSFSHYYDPKRIHWGALRVWNNDTIAPESGFPAHEHDNMEIITYVYKGAITHQDSLGNIGKIEAGQVQIMSAGSGVTHSEYNLEQDETQLFQIWLLPNEKNVKPFWETKPFRTVHKRAIILASGIKDDIQSGALPIHTNGRLSVLHLNKGELLTLSFYFKYVYLVSATGAYHINDILVQQGDGVAIKEESSIQIQAQDDLDLVFVESQ